VCHRSARPPAVRGARRWWGWFARRSTPGMALRHGVGRTARPASCRVRFVGTVGGDAVQRHPGEPALVQVDFAVVHRLVWRDDKLGGEDEPAADVARRVDLDLCQRRAYLQGCSRWPKTFSRPSSGITAITASTPAATRHANDGQTGHTPSPDLLRPGAVVPQARQSSAANARCLPPTRLRPIETPACEVWPVGPIGSRPVVEPIAWHDVTRGFTATRTSGGQNCGSVRVSPPRSPTHRRRSRSRRHGRHTRTPRGALVVSPTPCGTCADLAGIAEVCHRRANP
jgi:hypothetical protein